MSIMLASPYTLVQGDLIIAVIEAKNAIGWGSASIQNTVGILVQTVPLKPIASPSLVTQS